MKSSPLPPFRHLRGIAAAFLVATAWHPASSLADSSPPLFEIRAQFVHAFPAQLNKALVAAHLDQSATILTPAQYATARAALESSGAGTFCEPEIISQSGESASAELVKELRCPTKYEPSKKVAGKFVPTAFETRPVGETLQAMPELKADGRIQLKVTATYTRFLGFVSRLVCTRSFSAFEFPARSIGELSRTRDKDENEEDVLPDLRHRLILTRHRPGT